MTSLAAGLLEQIREHALLVPTTTRTLQQYARVSLPGGPPAYAVTSNGGHIVVERRRRPGLAPCRGHHDRRVRARRWRRSSTALPGRRTAPWVRNRRVADELFCYLVVDLAELPADFLPSWTSWCARRGWVVSVQGRKIYALPRGLTKEAALAEVLRRTGARRLLAAGDGALDAGFLMLADAAIRPAHGELRRPAGCDRTSGSPPRWACWRARRSVAGLLLSSGSPRVERNTLNFSALHSVEPRVGSG